MAIALKIPDMACSACVETITKAVRDLDGNASVETDLKAKTAAIDTDRPQAEVEAAIKEAGYTVEPVG